MDSKLKAAGLSSASAARHGDLAPRAAWLWACYRAHPLPELLRRLELLWALGLGQPVPGKVVADLRATPAAELPEWLLAFGTEAALVPMIQLARFCEDALVTWPDGPALDSRRRCQLDPHFLPGPPWTFAGVPPGACLRCLEPLERHEPRGASGLLDALEDWVSQPYALAQGMVICAPASQGLVRYAEALRDAMGALSHPGEFLRESFLDAAEVLGLPAAEAALRSYAGRWALVLQ